MSQNFKLGDSVYAVENLDGNAKEIYTLLQFVTRRVKELEGMCAILQQAKNSYVKNLKTEMLSKKSGFMFDKD